MSVEFTNRFSANMGVFVCEAAVFAGIGAVCSAARGVYPAGIVAYSALVVATRALDGMIGIFLIGKGRVQIAGACPLSLYLG